MAYGRGHGLNSPQLHVIPGEWHFRPCGNSRDGSPSTSLAEMAGSPSDSLSFVSVASRRLVADGRWDVAVCRLNLGSGARGGWSSRWSPVGRHCRSICFSERALKKKTAATMKPPRQMYSPSPADAVRDFIGQVGGLGTDVYGGRRRSPVDPNLRRWRREDSDAVVRAPRAAMPSPSVIWPSPRVPSRSMVPKTVARLIQVMTEPMLPAAAPRQPTS